MIFCIRRATIMHAYRHRNPGTPFFLLLRSDSHLIMFPGIFGLRSAFSFLPLRRFLLVYAYLSILEYYRIVQSTQMAPLTLMHRDEFPLFLIRILIPSSMMRHWATKLPVFMFHATSCQLHFLERGNSRCVRAYVSRVH